MSETKTDEEKLVEFQKRVAETAAWMNANDLPLLRPEVAVALGSMRQEALRKSAMSLTPCSEAVRGLYWQYAQALSLVAVLSLRRLEMVRQKPQLVIANQMPEERKG